MLPVGFDLGTYNCVASVRDEHRGVTLVPHHEHDEPHTHTWPAFVYYPSHGASLIGHAARVWWEQKPQRVVWAAKMLAGRGYHDFTDEEKDHLGYALSLGLGGMARILIPGHPPIEVEGVLSKLFETAVRDVQHLRPSGQVLPDDLRVVVGVPVAFSHSRRRAIRRAAINAGISEVELHSEPTLASMSVLGANRDRRTVLVFDMGAGTTDVTILDLRPAGTGWHVWERATAGAHDLGGIHIDRQFRAYITRAHGLDDSLNLRRQVEEAKVALSAEKYTYLEVAPGQQIQVTRRELNRTLQTSGLLERCVSIVRAATKKRLQSQITDLVFVGGPTQTPLIRAGIKDAIKGDVRVLETHPMHAVAIGAALVAARVATINGTVVPGTIGLLRASDGKHAALIPVFERHTIAPNERRFSVRVAMPGDAVTFRFGITIGKSVVEVLGHHIYVRRGHEYPFYVAIDCRISTDQSLELRTRETDENGRPLSEWTHWSALVTDYDQRRYRLAHWESTNPPQALPTWTNDDVRGFVAFARATLHVLQGCLSAEAIDETNNTIGALDAGNVNVRPLSRNLAFTLTSSLNDAWADGRVSAQLTQQIQSMLLEGMKEPPLFTTLAKRLSEDFATEAWDIVREYDPTLSNETDQEANITLLSG